MSSLFVSRKKKRKGDFWKTSIYFTCKNVHEKTSLNSTFQTPKHGKVYRISILEKYVNQNKQWNESKNSKTTEYATEIIFLWSSTIKSTILRNKITF